MSFVGFTHDGLLVIFSFVLVELVGAVELVEAVGRRRLHILEDQAHPWVRHLLKNVWVFEPQSFRLEGSLPPIGQNRAFSLVKRVTA